MKKIILSSLFCLSLAACTPKPPLPDRLTLAATAGLVLVSWRAMRAAERDGR